MMMAEFTSITRQDAMEIIAENELGNLSNEKRLEHLQWLNLEWDPGLDNSSEDNIEDEDYEFDLLYQQKVTVDVRRKIANGEYPVVMNSEFNDAISIILQFESRRLSNTYILQKLDSLGHKYDSIEGEKFKSFSCPCCGADTLSERHGWDICSVCWWEDDGTDNKGASLYYSGPNKGLQLTAARIFYLMCGIYNPERKDLLDKCEPIERYDRSRFFEIDEEKGIVFEKGTGWYAPLKPPHLKPGEIKPKVSLAGAGMRDWPPQDEFDPS